MIQCVMRRDDMAVASVKNSLPINVRNLENADFSGCATGGTPCQGAVSIRLNGPDPSSVMLECRQNKKYMSIEDAMACPRAYLNQA
jgi:hypothetical protein